mgnify:CR=1 FL=1
MTGVGCRPEKAGSFCDLTSTITIPLLDAREELEYNRDNFDFIGLSRKRAPALLLATVISLDSKSLRIPSRSHMRQYHGLFFLTFGG